MVLNIEIVIVTLYRDVWNCGVNLLIRRTEICHDGCHLVSPMKRCGLIVKLMFKGSRV